MSTTTSSLIPPLIASIKATFARRKPVDDAVGREIQRVVSLLEPLPPLTGKFPKSRHAITRQIQTVLQAGNESTAGLLDAIGPVMRFLPWRYSYPARSDAPNLKQNITFAEIVGPEAPFRSDSFCLGLTLIGPETLYPAHHHPAIELYYVAAGIATWTLAGAAQKHAPGTFILHPSLAVHAMQTHSEPLLAIYSWTGADVRTASVYTQSTSSDATKQTNSPN
jgi:mannose-6-phosphate isomerase-like protein (cupin superfamily)